MDSDDRRMKRSITNLKRKKLNSFIYNVMQVCKKLHISTCLLIPTNYSKEYKKFISSTSYNPQFTYRKITDTDVPIQLMINKLWHELLSLNLPLELEYYIESLLYHFFHLDLVRKSIGTQKFFDTVLKIYPYKENDINKIISSLPLPTYADSTNAPVMKAQDIQSFIRSYIESNNHLNDIDVKIDYYNRYSVRAGAKTLYIGSHVKRNEQNVIRLIVHEIESHILQKQNIYNGPLSLLLRKQNMRETFAEGIAIYNEVSTNTITKKAYDLYLYRFKAVAMMDKSFREIFEYLLPFMPRNKAYVTAFRVKRGIGDTEQPGGWPKDAVYLLGYKAVVDYLNSGGAVELLYKAQIPELGELLLKYDLLPDRKILMPEFLRG